MKLLVFALWVSHLFAFDHTHQDFTDVLKKHVTLNGAVSKVDYQQLKNSPQILEKYLNGLSKVKKNEYDQFTKKQQLSFLINAYNAFTLKLIIDHYPVKSIKDIGSFFSSPWSKDFISLFDKKVTLDDIEHQMIRKWFNEPRIHMAVNCASIGCPALIDIAFTDKNLEHQLHKATTAFLNDKNRNYYDKGAKVLYLSKIFKWYGGDFEKHSKYVSHYVLPYMNINNQDKALFQNGDIKIKYTDYDWNLNKK